MIRVAFTLLGGREWLGGHHYLVNLLTSLRNWQSGTLTPILFVGNNIPAEDLAAFTAIAGVEVVRSAHFNRDARPRRLAQALLWGLDVGAAESFRENGIDVAFEPAQFYGWRLCMPAIAWVPDFQDRHLPQMFSRRAHLQKWFGQWTQVLSGRTFMLSSEDSRADCERFYPATRGRTRVVRFAVPAPPELPVEKRAGVLETYGLPEHFFFLPNQFWRHKNHACVVRALEILKSQGPRITVAATGNPGDLRHREYFARLSRQISAAGVESNFRVLGIVPYEHVGALMQTAAALINPSRCEGWSTTVEEAKSSGTPLVLSNIGVHREQAGTSALYFSPDSPEQLAGVLRDFHPLPAEQRQVWAAQARTDAQGRLARFADEFARLVQDCLRQAHTGAFRH